MDGDEYVTMVSAADRAGIPITTLRQWIDSGQLPATAGRRGRLVRLADVQHLVALNGTSPGNATASSADAETGLAPGDNMARDAPGEVTAAAEGTETAATPPDEITAREPGQPLAGTAPAIEQASARQLRLTIVGNAVAFLAKLDQLYRAQLAAKDGEIAAKNELIGELRRRAERAEQQATLMEQKLADLRAHAEIVETEPVAPTAHPGLLDRLIAWYRRL